VDLCGVRISGKSRICWGTRLFRRRCFIRTGKSAADGSGHRCLGNYWEKSISAGGEGPGIINHKEHREHRETNSIRCCEAVHLEMAFPFSGGIF
jgi:hypothetical protein